MTSTRPDRRPIPAPRGGRACRRGAGPLSALAAALLAIPSMVVAAGAVVSSGGVSGCASCGPEPPPEPPPTPEPPYPPPVPDGPGTPPTPIDHAHGDYWLDRFGHVMRPELRALYLSTEKERRFERFGPYLLELAHRESMLAPVRARLTDADVRAFWALDGLLASRLFLEERAGRAAPPETPRPDGPPR